MTTTPAPLRRLPAPEARGEIHLGVPPTAEAAGSSVAHPSAAAGT